MQYRAISRADFRRLVKRSKRACTGDCADRNLRGEKAPKFSRLTYYFWTEANSHAPVRNLFSTATLVSRGVKTAKHICFSISTPSIVPPHKVVLFCGYAFSFCLRIFVSRNPRSFPTFRCFQWHTRLCSHLLRGILHENRMLINRHH
jgi:hypothetical protein